MKRIIVFIAFFAVFLAACIAPPLPEAFKTHATTFLSEASTLDAMTTQGVTFVRYGEQLAVVEGAYSLMTSSWPEGFAVDARRSLDQAMEGWRLTLKMWKIRIDRKDDPTEPDINGYQRFVDYAGPFLVYREYSGDFIVVAYRGKRYLPAKENIGVLMAVAGEHFRKGRDALIAEMNARK